MTKKAHMAFNINNIRQAFPILNRNVNGHPFVYLDNASTTQKPQCVLDALTRYYQESNANIHRGIHTLSEEATKQYEDARGIVARFINAASEEIIFTRNTTESINLVAYSWGRANIKKGDVIMVTEMEHHSNLLPWHALAQEVGAELRVIKVDGEGKLGDMDYTGVKLLALTHMSNVLGTINPVQDIIAQAHQAGALVLVDAAQSAAHMSIDVKALDCDFLAFSSHKLYGPTGVGVLYGKRELLENMSPFLYGGDMVKAVSLTRSHLVQGETLQGVLWNDIPWKFEAGTSNIADAIACAEALKFLEQLGWDKIQAYEKELTDYALEKLSTISGLKLYGPDSSRGPVFSFTLEGIHAHDLASLLNDQGIAIRSGHHCTMPLHEKLGIPATARMSLASYNTKEEIDGVVDAIIYVKQIFTDR